MKSRIPVPVVGIALIAFRLPAVVSNSWGQTSQESQNLSDKKLLPSGQGLAAEFSSDVGIASHRDVIFADNFQEGELGAAWESSRNEGGIVLQRVDTKQPPAPVGNKALQVTATLGKNTEGGLTKWFTPTDCLFIRFYTNFDADCDYVHHFCTLRANKVAAVRLC